MILKTISLEHLRNHTKKTFAFDKTTIIIGHNTAGKTNILEAIYLLSHGTSFRAARDADVIQEKYNFTRVEGKIIDASDEESVVLTTVFAVKAPNAGYLSKKYLVNGVARTLRTFSDYFYTVLFTPQDIEIITDTPGARRRYIDSILTKSHKQYRAALSRYEKALRQRNRMLHDIKVGKKDYKRQDFEFWEKLLIEHAEVIHNFRKAFVEYVNKAKKDVFQFEMVYDHSVLSAERLFKYHFEELSAGITLVGPQRDDFQFLFPKTKQAIKEFGSRGEERLTILQLKLIEIEYLKQSTGELPVLLLDDIFSELDSENIDMIYKFIENQQTIITTTHREFVPKKILKQKGLKIIEL
ncbi:MAG: DNA replication/repair protein RecF [Candidatus Levyibacteriota bacterium]